MSFGGHTAPRRLYGLTPTRNGFQSLGARDDVVELVAPGQFPRPTVEEGFPGRRPGSETQLYRENGARRGDEDLPTVDGAPAGGRLRCSVRSACSVPRSCCPDILFLWPSGRDS